MRHTKDEKDFYKPTGNGAPCNQFTEERDKVTAADGSCIDARSTTVSRAGLEGSQIDQRNAVLPPSQYAFVADSSEVD